MAALVFYGESWLNPLAGTPLDAVAVFLFMTTCVGLIVAWRW